MAGPRQSSLQPINRSSADGAIRRSGSRLRPRGGGCAARGVWIGGGAPPTAGVGACAPVPMLPGRQGMFPPFRQTHPRQSRLIPQCRGMVPMRFGMVPAPSGIDTPAFGMATAPPGMATAPSGINTRPLGIHTAPSGMAAAPFGMTSRAIGYGYRAAGIYTIPSGMAPFGAEKTILGRKTGVSGPKSRFLVPNAPEAPVRSSFCQYLDPAPQ